MLFSVESGQYVTKIPHEANFMTWCSRLSVPDLTNIRVALERVISASEIETSSWMPGDDWTGTPWEPIYSQACRRDEEAAAKCFGIFVWQTVLRDRDVWGFGRYEKDGVPIHGMTYFKLDNPPPAPPEALSLVGT
jgi:hypothetical protein